MRLENASVNQWEQKCNGDGSSAVELTIRADIVKDGSPSTFCNPDVRRDFEDYISKYKYNGGFSRPRKTVVDLKKENDILRTSLDYEIKKKNEFSEQLAIMSAKENNAVLCLKNISLLLGINEDSSAREVFDKVKELSEGLEKLREDVDALCDASKKAGSVCNGVYLDDIYGDAATALGYEW